MPRSKTGRKRDHLDADSINNAVKAILSDNPDTKMSFREAAKVFKVSRSTLTRHVTKFKTQHDAETFEYSVNYAVKKVFSEAEEDSLVNYIKTVAKMQYGLTKKGIRQLAYKFATANNKQFPATWKNCRRGMAAWLS